jgi:O-antigen ligase
VGLIEISAMLMLAGVAGIAMVEVLVRRTDVGAALVLGVLVWQVGFSGLVNLEILVGPVRVSPQDILLALISTAAAARLLRLDRLNTPQRLLMMLILIAIVSLARGIPIFGIQTAVNEARRPLRFLATALYFSTVEPRRGLMHRLGWIWLSGAAALALIVLARWFGGIIGLSNYFFIGSEGSIRVVHSDQALILAQSALIALPLFLDKQRGLTRYIAPALLPLILILQHRTVWVATIAGTIYILYRERAVAQRVLVILLTASAIFLILVNTVFDDISEVSDQLADSAQRTNTFEWRVAGWQALLDQAGPESPTEVAVGRPYGSGWERRMAVVSNTVTTVSPHNLYLETFLRFGALGLVLFFSLYAFALLGTRQRSISPRLPDLSLFSPSVLHVVVAMQLVYYTTYAADTAQAMLLGLTCAAAAARERRVHGPRPSAEVGL